MTGNRVRLPPPTEIQSREVVGRLSGLLSGVSHLGVGRLIAQYSSGTLPPRAQEETDARAWDWDLVRGILQALRTPQALNCPHASKTLHAGALTAAATCPTAPQSPGDAA